MGVKWTEEQEKVIRLRNRNILVSAAAGSGKTAVLVERIITMLTKDDPPMDVDRLLIVTFTEAAASEMKERILQASKDFGLQEFWETEPGKLSRGEKKLLVLAFCSAQDTPLYLLDEPTSALSGESILKVKNWLIKLLSQGKTVIMVEHNPYLSSLASQILDLGL